MSGKEKFSSASGHDSQAELPDSRGGITDSPPPIAPVAQPARPPDDVTLSSAGSERTLSPAREVALPLPLTGSTRKTTKATSRT